METKPKKKATATKRKAIPKKTRFEVFKRDKFTCQYCGRKSPDVILNADHIKPVASGGTNRITNLVTSCFDCNSGKGKRELSDDSVVEKQRTELEIQQEKLNQIKLMADWHMSLLSVDDAGVDAVCDMIGAIADSVPNDSGKKLLRKWIKKHGLNIVMESCRASYDQYYESDDDWAKSFDMIPKIAAIKSMPESIQEFFKYSNYAKQNGYNYDDSKLLHQIKSGYQEKLERLDFSKIFNNRMDLRAFLEAVMDEAGLGYSEGE